MSRSTQTRSHWGHWLRQRVKVLGIRRNTDLAEAIGCRPDRLSRWFQMPTPPAAFRKGFDTALCAALETDRDTLFSGYASVAAEEAPRLKPDAVKDDSEVLREIVNGATRLCGERLRLAAVMVRSLVEATPAKVA